MSELKPTRQQTEAIYSQERNILLSAGAGSGKTRTLTERIIELIKGGVDISEILAVTFTNAAAEELKERISKAISKAIQQNPEDKRLRLQLVLCENAKISTIDSFFKSEIQPYHAELMLPPDFGIIDETEAKVLKESTMHDVIEEYYREQNAEILRLFDSISNGRNENGLEEKLYKFNDALISKSMKIETLVETLLEVADESDGAGDILDTRYFSALKTYITDIVEYFEKAYADACAALRNDANPNNQKAFTALDSDCALIERLKGYHTYEEYHNFFAEEHDFPQYQKSKSEIAVAFHPILESFRKKFGSKEKIKYFDDEVKDIKAVAKKTARAFELLGKVFERYRKAYSAAKRDMGTVDFADITVMAEKLFVNDDGTPTERALKAGKKYKHIFIDEYQDTSRAQDRIFAAIATKRNRFTVGDIKQSIYGFRSACPDVFREYRESYEKGAGCVIFMSDNFRCDREIIDVTNLVSDFIFMNSGTPFEEDDKLNAAKLNIGPGNVEFIVADGDHESKIANKIAEILNNETLSNGEKVKPSDIAILSPTKTYTPSLEAELKKRGIPVFNSTTDSFYKHAETLLLTCILNMVNNPLKDVYLTGAMKSPLFCFTLDDLVKIRRKERLPFWYSLASYVKEKNAEPELCKKIEAFVSVVMNLRKHAQKDDALEAANRIIAETGFAVYGGDENISPADVKNCIKILLTEAATIAKNGGNLGDLVKRIDYLSASDSSVNFTKSEDCVNILTIHKSKGLEFPIVFMIGCQRDYTSEPDKDPPMRVDGDGAATIKLFDDNDYLCGKTNLFNIAKLTANQNAADEEARLLYVGMTRAQERLYLCAKIRSEIKDVNNIKDFNVCPYEPLDMRYAVTSRHKYLDWLVAAFAKKNATIFKHVHAKNIDAAIDVVKYEKGLLSETEADPELAEFFDCENDFEYKYDYLSTVPQKLSVSALKPDALDLDDGEEDESPYFGSPVVNIDEIMPVPAFMKPGKRIKGSDVGTATHIFMQFCDWDNLIKNGPEAEKARLIEKEFITEEDAALVNLDEIEKFRNSSLIKRMTKAKKVIKERRFNAELPAYEFTTDDELRKKLEEGGDTITIQGVVDCMFYDEDGKLVLIDYKTDTLTEAEKKDKALAAKKLIPRHKTQLETYSKICASILGRSFDEVYIYSVPLGDVIDIFKEEG